MLGAMSHGNCEAMGVLGHGAMSAMGLGVTGPW